MGKISKEEAAKLLGVSERTLERNEARYRDVYGLKVEREQGKTKRVPVYDEANVLAVAERLKTAHVESDVVGPEGAGTLATPNDNPDRLAALLSAIVAGADTRPLLWTKAQAVAGSGLPESWLELAVRHGHVRPVGRGVGWRVRRDEVLAFAGRDDLAELLDGWRPKALKAAAAE